MIKLIFANFGLLFFECTSLPNSLNVENNNKNGPILK